MGDARGRCRASAGRRLLAVVAVLAALLLGGCRAGLSVEVEAAVDGSGHVRAVLTLDREAAGQVPDLARQLRVDDLEAAGWVVEGPDRRPDGTMTLRLAKAFRSEEGAARAVEELSGRAGPFSGLRLATSRTLWRTTTSLRGTVDLGAGLDAFGDPALAQLLGGPGLGLDPAALERELGRPLGEVVDLELVARLPGPITSSAPDRRPGAVAWPLALGSTTVVSASSQAWNARAVAGSAVALAAALALVVVLLRRRRTRE